MKTDVLVVTAWAYPGRPLEDSPFVRSCAHFEVPLLVLQQGETYRNSYENKVRRFFPEIRGRSFDVLLWIDADDAFLTRDPRQGALDALESYEADFLMGAEVQLWPWYDKLHPHFPNRGRCSNPNAGVWTATRQAILREFPAMIDFAENDTERYEEGGRHLRNEDQALFQAWMSLGQGRIALDTREELVLNLSGLDVPEQAFFLDLLNQRLPPIVHGPGIGKEAARSLWRRFRRCSELHVQQRYDFPPDASELLCNINSTAGLACLLAELPPLASVAEIGCHRGVSTELLALFAQQVFAVDIWPDETIYHDFSRRMAPYPHVTPLRKPSIEAARCFPPRSLDLVYIDADHSYAAVRADIDAWLPTLREGGFLAGHDYAPELPLLHGVVAAVDESFGKSPRVFSDRSWLVQIPYSSG